MDYARGFEDIVKLNVEVNSIGIYIVNLLSLNRPVRFKEHTISFKTNALGTKYPTDGMTAEALTKDIN